MIVLTNEMLESLRTEKGGYTQATTEALGVAWPLQSGWKHRMVGVSISDKAWREAVAAAKRGPIVRRRGNTRRHRLSVPGCYLK